VSSRVEDAHPPDAVLRVINPIVKTLLRTPISRLIRALALLEFTTRHSGRRIAVVVGFHVVGDAYGVFTPAPWRHNFAGGRTAMVRYRGRREALIGNLVSDPGDIASALGGVIAGGTSPRALGLRVPAGHTITADDIARLGRGLVRFPANSAAFPGDARLT
jgi:hypothetical protein